MLKFKSKNKYSHIPEDEYQQLLQIKDPTKLASHLLSFYLPHAYKEKAPSDDILDYVKNAHKPGKVCAVYFFGRSGSYFAQSFFDNAAHPHVLTFHPPALGAYDYVVTQEKIDYFNHLEITDINEKEQWCSSVLEFFEPAYKLDPSQPGFDSFCVSQELFFVFFFAQLLSYAQGEMTFELCLKSIFVANRMARGEDIDLSQNPVFLWQAHVPTVERKKWFLEHFSEPLLLNVVRFPEKALDSHIIHHGYESLSPPMNTLFRRLFFEHMVVNNEPVAPVEAKQEYVIRFEDLHHHTAFVLQRLCEWFEVPYMEHLVSNNFSMQVRGKKVSGARKLTPMEFTPKLLNFSDTMKIRQLLAKEYQAWGYETFCHFSMEASHKIYESDELIRNLPFTVQYLLAAIDDTSPKELKNEVKLQKQLYQNEIVRREKGIDIVPLLYDLNNLDMQENKEKRYG